MIKIETREEKHFSLTRFRWTGLSNRKKRSVMHGATFTRTSKKLCQLAIKVPLYIVSVASRCFHMPNGVYFVECCNFFLHDALQRSGWLARALQMFTTLCALHTAQWLHTFRGKRARLLSEFLVYQRIIFDLRRVPTCMDDRSKRYWSRNNIIPSGMLFERPHRQRRNGNQCYWIQVFPPRFMQSW